MLFLDMNIYVKFVKEKFINNYEKIGKSRSFRLIKGRRTGNMQKNLTGSTENENVV